MYLTNVVGAGSVQKLSSDAIGLNINRELLPDVMSATEAPFDFFEIAPENWINAPSLEVLDRLHAKYPAIHHGLSLSLGSPEPLNEQLLNDLAIFFERFKPALYSEHLSFSSLNGQFYELLSLPFNDNMVQYLVGRRRFRICKKKRTTLIRVLRFIDN